MSKYDLFLCPSSATPAFDIGLFGPETVEGRHDVDIGNRLPALWPFNESGQPAASIPAGWTSDGLPVGLQIVGRHLDDAMVMRAAAAYEQVRPWRDRWPDIIAKAAGSPAAATGTFG
jgi:aspartyl-tRNA(Asn)/glutamyl-tRNA(Gln) amidotransferase subunit A